MSAELVDRESSSVQTHLTILQNVIQRMASDSNACKFWCLTLVSAILVIVGQGGKTNCVPIAFLPAASLLILNIYYHAQELKFRSYYDEFVANLHSGEIDQSMLFSINFPVSIWGKIAPSFCSFSIWPFYIVIFVMIILVWLVVL